MLALIFAVGMIAAGAALIIRAVVPQPWLLNKPLSCDLCMSFWSSVVFGMLIGTNSIPAVVGGVAVSVLVLKAVNRLGD